MDTSCKKYLGLGGGHLVGGELGVVLLMCGVRWDPLNVKSAKHAHAHCGHAVPREMTWHACMHSHPSATNLDVGPEDEAVLRADLVLHLFDMREGGMQGDVSSVSGEMLGVRCMWC